MNSGGSRSELIVHIDAQGSIYALSEDSGERLTTAESQEYVERLLDEDPSINVIVERDPQASTAALVRVLDWLTQHGASMERAPTIAEQ